MLRKSLVVKMLAVGALLAGVSYGDLVKNYNYTGGSLSMAHNTAMEWVINQTLATGEKVTGASLTLNNVYEDPNNIYNALWVDLLSGTRGNVNGSYNNIGDDNGTGVVYINGVPYTGSAANEGELVDRFVTEGYTLDQLDRINWNYVQNSTSNAGLYDKRDSNGNLYTESSQRNFLTSSRTNSVVINFTGTELDALNSYIKDGNFGFGLDADCHFNIASVQFNMTTTTTSVPEPTLISLLGCSLLGLLFVRRKK